MMPRCSIPALKPANAPLVDSRDGSARGSCASTCDAAGPVHSDNRTVACPVCASTAIDRLLQEPPRDYFRCARCWSMFLHPQQRPGPVDEAAHYRLHRNEIDDPGYRAFLSRLSRPLIERLPAHASGLDFGCGRGPALAQMLREAGFVMELYDPLFAPDADVLAQRYDFVTCTEVAEHLHDPAATFARLFGLLRPGGMLAVMTGFTPSVRDFGNWHYRRDPTHVVFYHPSTFRWLAAQHGAACEIPCRDVALLRTPG